MIGRVVSRWWSSFCPMASQDVESLRKFEAFLKGRFVLEVLP